MDKKLGKRILLTKHPLDGHPRGFNVLAVGLRDAGFEVILGDSLLSKEIVQTAIQEDVNLIGYRIMTLAPIILFQQLFEEIKRVDGFNIPIVVGGFISEEDVQKLKDMGVIEVFHPGSSLASITEFLANYDQNEITRR